MDTSRHKFTNSNSWEPYNMSMENHIIHQNPFDHHTQWSNHPLIIQEPSNNSSSTLLLAPSNLLGIEETENFKREADEEQEQEDAEEELGAMKEMMFKIAAMQPVDIDPATIRKPKRRNVRISDDPQSVAARHRRERISEKIRILQRLVPGGTKMDTASMLDEAIRYVKFLKRQIRLLQANHHHHQHQPPCVGLTTTTSTDVDWVALTNSAAISGTPSYNLFEGNNNSDGAGHDDHYSMRHNLKFIGQ